MSDFKASLPIVLGSAVAGIAVLKLFEYLWPQPEASDEVIEKGAVGIKAARGGAFSSGVSSEDKSRSGIWDPKTVDALLGEGGTAEGAGVTEQRHRMHPAHAPGTPADAVVELKRVKDSMAWCSNVARALTEMPRDLKANKFMDMAVEEACSGVVMREGGPFGAVVTMKDENGVEEVISRGHNMVLQTQDPTAHAEVTAIRKACARLGTYDLKDCTLYTSCYPCPMCYGAIHWAKIPVCYYAAEATDAAAAGFDDKFIYDSIKETAMEEKVQFIKEASEGAVSVFQQTYDRY